MLTLDRLSAALADRYRIERELGHGGMATVYLARDLKHDRDVALKVLRPELAEVVGKDRFLAEIRTTANLRHPHILPLFDSGEADGLLFYVMPLAEGETLRTRLDRDRQLPIAEALRITAEVADALAYAHARGVIHRDIKPDNILLEAGHAVVADFGIARAISAGGGDRLTLTGMSVGTPAYMSPEQAAGEQDVDGRADLYSLACVLYEMLGGQPPFIGPSAAALIRQHLVADAPPVTHLRPSVPPHIASAISRALAKSPVDRFALVADFAAALIGPPVADASVAAASVATAAPVTATPIAPRPSRVRPLTALAAVALVVLAFIGWKMFRSRAGTAPSSTSIAVLPFSDLSADRSQAYLGDGIAETLISALAQATDITVLPRSVSFAQRERDGDLKSVGRALGVGTVLEGSVQRSGDRLRITSALVSVIDGGVLWSQTFDRRADDIFAVQDEVVRAVLAELQGRIRASRVAFTTTAGTSDRAAYELYLQGLYFWNRRSLADFGRAEEMFRRAIARDSTYAAPLAGLANVFVTLAFVDTAPPREVLGRARAAAEQAVRLDSAQGDAYATLAYLRLLLDRDFDAADSAFRDVRARFPKVVMGAKWYADVLAASGATDSAMVELRAALALDPALAITMYNIAWLHQLGGQPDSAALWYDRSLQAAPRLVLSLLEQARNAAARGDSATTLAMLARLQDASSLVAVPIDELARAWGRGGANGLARLMGEPQRNPRVPGSNATWLAIAGDYDGALRAWDAVIATGGVNALYLASRPEFDPIRGDPRFRERMVRSGLPAVAVERFVRGR